MARITIDDIRAVLEPEGWNVISSSYKSLDTEMTFQCPEGHNVFSNWKRLRAKRECPVCKQNAITAANAVIITKPRGTTRVLALDQATKITGYSIFDNNKLVKYGTFKAPDGEDVERLAAIKAWLLSMIANLRPDYIALEGIQYQEHSGENKMGVTVFQALARLQGVLMLACFEEKIPCIICPSNTWRHYCGVKGRTRADRKKSTQLLVKEWYDISVSDDEADAIGIGRYLANYTNQLNNVVDWDE